MKGLKVHFGSQIEKVHEFKYKGRTYFGELHCFSGWFVSDSNRMGIFDDDPATLHFIEKVLPKLEEDERKAKQ
jgi:hypothetical protein